MGFELIFLFVGVTGIVGYMILLETVKSKKCIEDNEQQIDTWINKHSLQPWVE